MKLNVDSREYEKIELDELREKIRNLSVEKSASGFEEISYALQSGFNKSLPAAFYILKADCGLGKSRRVQEEIRKWKANCFSGCGSIIIALKTLKEIDDYIFGSGVGVSDYAVISDPRFNAYGLGRHKAGLAKVLFTTHEQFDRRVRENDSFETTDLFHYMGGPRSLLIWDEGLHLVPPVSISYDTLAALPDAVGYVRTELKERLYQYKPDRRDLEDGGPMIVPEDAKAVADQLLEARPNLAVDKRCALEALGKLAGRTAFCKRYNDGWALVGTGKPLPYDMPATIVLDASGRLTDRYDAWERQGWSVVQFTPVTSSYSNLTIQWIDRATNKTSMRDNDKRHETYRIAASIMNGKPTEPWLIVIAKEFVEGMPEGKPPAELAAMLDGTVDCTALTWGMHVGSNNYRHFRNMLVIGALEYPVHAYDAIDIAKSTSLNPTAPNAHSAKEIEFMHNIYQAVCRSNVRNHSGGVCGKAEVHFIMATKGNRMALAKRAFPDAKIIPTLSPIIKPRGKVEIVISALTSLFIVRSSVTYYDLREKIGREKTDKHYLTKPLKSAEVRAWLTANNIQIIKRRFVRSSLLPT